jgi:hypothetical protein
VRLDDEILQQAVTAFEQAGGNTTRAAGLLGIPRTTLQDRLKLATQRGLSGHVRSGPLPQGLLVAGTSTYYQATEDGQPAQWVKTKAEIVLQDVVDALTDVFAQYRGMAFIPPNRSPANNADLLTVYPLADLHLGMYSWQDETGEDFDLELGRALALDAVAELVDASPPAKQAILLNLGDFFHSDSNDNRTRRSGNVLDVDTRYAKVLRTGIELMVQLTQRILEKHETVLIRNLQGNHDPYGALALGLALDAYFTGHPRVTVDASPSPFWWYRFGRVLLGATHGDMAKPINLINIMAAKRAQDWGETKYRYAYLGHVHQKNKGGEIAGAEWETFQTLSPKDAWANSMGFTSGRSMQSITHHIETGEKVRLTVNVKGPE